MKLQNRLLSITAVALAGFGFSLNTTAGVQWSDNSLTALSGGDYKLTPDGEGDAAVLTLEHVSGHSWGDLFFFVDHLRFDNGDTENYWELSPRVSLGKVSKKELSFGPVKDVLIASTWESETGPGGFSFDNYLYGVGFDLDVPGFAYTQANFYYRNNDLQEDNWQTTLVWGIPFKLGSLDFVYDGFADYESGTEEEHQTLNFTSQLKLDLGALWEMPKKLYLGVEYVHWTNKFGVEDGDFGLDTNERNVNLLLKLHL